MRQQEDHGSKCGCPPCLTEKERYELRTTVTASSLHRKAVAQANGHAAEYGWITDAYKP